MNKTKEEQAAILRELQEKLGLQEEKVDNGERTRDNRLGPTEGGLWTTEGGNTAMNGSAQAAGGYEPDNGYYELKDCRVKDCGQVQTFRAGTSEESQMRTIVFEYKPKKSDRMAQICADAWNETIRYNDFAVGSYYDLSLRISARQSKDGRWWPSVSVVFAHRLREVGR